MTRRKQSFHEAIMLSGSEVVQTINTSDLQVRGEPSLPESGGGHVESCGGHVESSGLSLG